MWSLSRLTVVGVVLVTTLSSCKAQCHHNRQCNERALRPPSSWRILPMWHESPFYDLSSAFDDPWFHQLDQIPRSIEEYERDLSWPQFQDHYDAEKELPDEYSRQAQCRRERDLQAKQEMMQHEEAQRQQRLADLNRKERALVEEQQRRVQEFRQQEQEFAQRQEQIHRIRRKELQVQSSSTEKQRGDELSTKQTREAEVLEMKKRQQEMARQQQKLVQDREKQQCREEERAKLREEQRQRAELVEQKKQAEFEEKQRQEELQQRRRHAELEEQAHQQELERNRLENERRWRAQNQEQQRRQEEQRQHASIREERLQTSHMHDSDRNQHHTGSSVLLAKHLVTGYDPDDITIMVADGRLKVDGKHICHCNENCIVREFARSYQLQPNIDYNTITTTLDINGNIKIQGRQNIDGESSQSESRKVKVQGLNIPQSTKPSTEELRKCLGEKGGIKLNKVNKQTGKAHVDESYKYEYEILEPKSTMSNNDLSYDEYDDSSVEVVDYY